jgi:ferritin
MIPKKVEGAMNEQFALELNSFYSYLSMSAYFEAETLPGFAQWLRTQAEEELEHAMKFYTFVNDRGGRLRFDALNKPTEAYSSPLAVFDEALENERSVTQAINELYALAIAENDYASQAFLNWFVTEQVEEEKVVGEIVDSLRRVGEAGEALFLLDKELGGRAGEG